MSTPTPDQSSDAIPAAAITAAAEVIEEESVRHLGRDLGTTGLRDHIVGVGLRAALPLLSAASAPQGDTLQEVAIDLADGMAQIATVLGLDVEAGEVGPIVERVRALVQQGDTADVIERAAAIIHKNACDCGPSSGHSAEFQHEFGEPDEGHYETARELSAAGLLAVSPAPDSLDLDALAGGGAVPTCPPGTTGTPTRPSSGLSPGGSHWPRPQRHHPKFESAEAGQ